MHAFVLFIGFQHLFRELWKSPSPSLLLCLKNMMLLEIIDISRCISPDLCVLLSSAAGVGMPKPKAGRGISDKWTRLPPLEPRTC